MRPTISLQSGEGDMHEVCEIAAKMSERVARTGCQRNHSTLFPNTVRTPSVQALLGEYPSTDFVKIDEYMLHLVLSIIHQRNRTSHKHIKKV